jgi:chemotaxis protein MotA
VASPSAQPQPNKTAAAAPDATAAARPAALPRLAPLKRALDPATVFGLAGALLMVVIALVADGSFKAFFNLPSALIVIGGTIAVTTVSQSWAEVRLAARLAGEACASCRWPTRCAGTGRWCCRV